MRPRKSTATSTARPFRRRPRSVSPPCPPRPSNRSSRNWPQRRTASPATTRPPPASGTTTPPTAPSTGPKPHSPAPPPSPHTTGRPAGNAGRPTPRRPRHDHQPQGRSREAPRQRGPPPPRSPRRHADCRSRRLDRPRPRRAGQQPSGSHGHSIPPAHHLHAAVRPDPARCRGADAQQRRRSPPARNRPRTIPRLRRPQHRQRSRRLHKQPRLGKPERCLAPSDSTPRKAGSRDAQPVGGSRAGQREHAPPRGSAQSRPIRMGDARPRHPQGARDAAAEPPRAVRARRGLREGDPDRRRRPRPSEPLAAVPEPHHDRPRHGIRSRRGHRPQLPPGEPAVLTHPRLGAAPYPTYGAAPDQETTPNASTYDPAASSSQQRISRRTHRSEERRVG